MTHRSLPAVLLCVALTAPSLRAAEIAGGGRLVGWVENSRGEPVAGAVISLFGRGLQGGGLVTLSDSAGRFLLSSLPAGFYTLRALGHRDLAAAVRQVTVLPNSESVFSVNLTSIQEAAAVEPEKPEGRELGWLLRHKRRSVLEYRHAGVPASGSQTTPAAASLLDRVPWLPDVDGTLELVTSPALLGGGGDALGAETPASSLGVVRLRGRFADSGHWSLSGLLTESASSAWRMAAEFVVEPGGGHKIQAGTGYGSRFVQPLVPAGGKGGEDGRSVGAIFVEDRWELSGRLAASLGARYSYLGFLTTRNRVDPAASVEFRKDRRTRVRGAVTARTLSPGGDLLTVSTLATAPAIAFAVMSEDLSPERMVRYEVSVDRAVGPNTITAHTFHEGVRDQLVNAFDGPRHSRSLQILNGPGVSARGVGLTLARHFGDHLSGSVTYTYGHAWRGTGTAPPSGDLGLLLSFRDGDFQDVVGRFETFLNWSDTRATAFYRFNTLSSKVSDGKASQTVRSSRFDVQLTQGLPFLGTLTRADWELLLAFRNLFYETSEGSTLDEVAVVNPPKRVLGGVSVRF